MSFFEGVDLSIGSYDLQNKVDQRIMKNGLRVSVPVGDRWLFEAYGIHTQFFRSAAVSGYFTLGATVGYRLVLPVYGQRVDLGYFSLGLYSEVGNHYSSGHVQVGTAWKF
ncbi:MAG: hypothetical protein JO069_01010 [Verrucomicrobia bacterium]|nr:hypothetical protein [Verrucomicrobiota bacterium]